MAEKAKTLMNHRWGAVIALGALLAPSVPGQSDYPDLASVESYGDRFLYRYVWNGGGGTYSKNGIRGVFWGGVHLDIDNESVISWFLPNSTGYLVSVDASGTMTTLFSRPRASGCPIHHQSGNLLVPFAENNAFGLDVRTREGTLVRTFPTQIPFQYSTHWVEVVQDLESGDYFLFDSGDPNIRPWSLFRITEAGAVTTMTPPNYFGERGWDQDSRTRDWYAFAWFGTPPRPPNANGRYWSRFRLSPPTQPVLVWTDPLLRDPVRVHEGRALFGLHRTLTIPSQWSVVRYQLPAGPATLIPAGQDPFYGVTEGPIEIIGRRPVAGRGPATPGSDYDLLVHFLREGGKAYQLAASGGVRPGINVGARNIPLNVDGLFLQSLTIPAIFVGFSGVLDATGRATARVRLPALAGLRGFRMFFSGVTYDAGGIRKIAEPIGMTVQ